MGKIVFFWNANGIFFIIYILFHFSMLNMLRCASRLCLRLQEHAVRVLPAVNPSLVQIHTSANFLSLERDDRTKKQLIKMAQEEKIETLNVSKTEAEVEIDIDGMNSSGISIPTLETM